MIKNKKLKLISSKNKFKRKNSKNGLKGQKIAFEKWVKNCENTKPKSFFTTPKKFELKSN